MYDYKYVCMYISLYTEYGYTYTYRRTKVEIQSRQRARSDITRIFMTSLVCSCRVLIFSVLEAVEFYLIC